MTIMTCNSGNQNLTYRFEQFRQSNKHLFENNIIRLFFEKTEHINLFYDYIDYNTSFHYSRLQQAFQRFFFNIRFKKYLYSLIKFANVDYGRKIKKEKERYICSFDSPVGEEGEVTLGEILVIKMEDRVENTIFKDPELFSMSFDNEMLYFAFSKLSQRQKRVLTLVFSGDFRDSQIARQLSVSQQAVSKTKTTALHNIRMEMCQLGYSGSSSRKEIS